MSEINNGNTTTSTATEEVNVNTSQNNSGAEEQTGKAETPVVKQDEDLAAEIARLRTENAKLKTTNDKVMSENGTLRKKYNATLSEQEQNAIALKEQEELQKEHVKELERFKAITEASDRYRGMGMSGELAKETATAEVDMNMDKVTNNITQFMQERDKKLENDFLAKYGNFKAPQSGNGSSVDYDKLKSDALSANDMSAYTRLIREEFEANQPH